MKFLLLKYLFLFLIIKPTLTTKQNMLTNHEIREILKCFGNLDLNEACVICRYVTQKIYKVLDISTMCPDIVETKLLPQRERAWKPDPQIINKWVVLYNLQKDYINRLKPAADQIKNYDIIMHQKKLKEKIKNENLANLIQFQKHVNNNLARSQLTKLDQKEEDCDDEDLKYKHNQNLSGGKDLITNPTNSLKEYNKLMMDKLKLKNQDLHDGFIGLSKIDSNKITSSANKNAYSLARSLSALNLPDAPP